MVDFKVVLGELPSGADVAHRADVLSQIYFLEDCTVDSSTYKRYFWEDGSGNEWTAIIQADQENIESILLFAYDHESAFNYYNKDAKKQNIFDGLPKSFEYLLDEENLKWSWDTNDEKIVYATSAAWLESKTGLWQASKKFIEEAEENNDDGGFIDSFKFFLSTKFDLKTFLSINTKDYEAEDLKFLETLF